MLQALIDYLAKQPEALLDAPGDPRVGMHGGSYAGGIELVAAGFEPRIDAIAPDIAWHSLLTALYKEETVKGGWSLALYGAGVPTSGLEGIVSPAGVQTGNLDPHITSAFVTGASTGKLSAEDRAWFDSRGPASLVNAIHVPTLLIQGTADTLFTLNEAITNYGILRGNGVPTKMVWFCGGHGACLTGGGEAGHVERAVIAWMKRYLAKDASVDTGPRFEWLADDAKWRSAADYPPPAGAPLVAEGAGRLLINPADTASGTPVAAGRAANAVNVAVPAPSAAVQAVGEPALSLTYTATGAAPEGYAFAQIVDETRGVVVGNQVRPIPLVLDGKQHTIQRPLEGIAASLTPQSKLTLQITGGSQVYGPARTAADVQIAKARLSIPTVGAGAGSGRRRRAAGLPPLPVAAQLRDPPARAPAGPPAAARHARHRRGQAREGLPQARARPRPRQPARAGAGARAREGRGPHDPRQGAARHAGLPDLRAHAQEEALGPGRLAGPRVPGSRLAPPKLSPAAHGRAMRARLPSWCAARRLRTSLDRVRRRAGRDRARVRRAVRHGPRPDRRRRGGARRLHDRRRRLRLRPPR